MNPVLSLGKLSAKTGKRTAGYLPLTIKDVNFRLPVFLLNGIEPGPTLVVTAGIHGGEFPCVEAASRLGQSIDPERLQGRMIIVPSANPVAFKARSIFVTPVDNKNLNRHFPGNNRGTFTPAWAHWLFTELIQQGDYYIDMHGGDMVESLVPFTAISVTGKGVIDEASRTMAREFGIRAILERADTPGGIAGSTHVSATRVGIPSILVEAGGSSVWHEHEVEILQNGVRRVMHQFDMYERIDEPGEEPEIYTEWAWLRAEHDGVFYPAVKVGDRVEEGQPVGRVADLLGREFKSYQAPKSGEVLFLLSSLSVNKGEPLMSIAY